MGRILLTEGAFKFLKYLEISFTSLGDLVKIESRSLLILAGTVLEFILFIAIVYRLSFQSIFTRNLLSEGILVTVSMERIPS